MLLLCFAFTSPFSTTVYFKFQFTAFDVFHYHRFCFSFFSPTVSHIIAPHVRSAKYFAPLTFTHLLLGVRACIWSAAIAACKHSHDTVDRFVLHAAKSSGKDMSNSSFLFALRAFSFWCTCV